MVKRPGRSATLRQGSQGVRFGQRWVVRRVVDAFASDRMCTVSSLPVLISTVPFTIETWTAGSSFPTRSVCRRFARAARVDLASHRHH